MVKGSRIPWKRRSISDEHRFWSKVDTTFDGGCWNWTAGKSGGYGTIRWPTGMEKANRIAWLLTHSFLPPHLDVCHTCDNPGCCNPMHLFLATRAQNNADKDRKGRGGGGWKWKRQESQSPDDIASPVKEFAILLPARVYRRRGAGDEYRFWSKVATTFDGSCWLWTATKNRSGYGTLFWQGRAGEKAHRVAWQLTHSVLPLGREVCHACDNRLCCNPGHLFLATRQQNVADKVAKGRQAKGEQLRYWAWTKLSWEAVDDIRALYSTGQWSQRRLARKHGISQMKVSEVIRNRSWKIEDHP